MAIDVIKQLLERFDSEDGWLNVIKVLKNNENQKKKPQFCHFCNKWFAPKKNVKVHIEKFHQLNVNYSCEVCEYKAKTEMEMKKHVNTKHRLPVIQEEEKELEILETCHR